MNNVISCLVFNLVGLGSYYFLSLFTKGQKKLILPGTSVFWGFWVGMLFTYTLWVIIPNKFNIACYITFSLSVIGIIFFIKNGLIRFFFRSEYFLTLLLISPFLFFAEYIPVKPDEVAHWFMFPKIFYYEHSLIPSKYWLTGTYTPLWTLQAAFFQFFSFGEFSESLVFAVRTNLFVAFVFFIKEKFNLRFFIASSFSLGVMILFYLFTKRSVQYFLVEFPIYLLFTAVLFTLSDLKEKNKKAAPEGLYFLLIAFFSSYMIKKPLIAAFPAFCYILWMKGYRKHLIYSIFIFTGLFLSWKMKTAHMIEPWKFGFKIEGLWNARAIAIYQEIIKKSFILTIPFSFFLGSMIIIYRENKDVFSFYILFSVTYFFGLIFSYLFSFPDYEAYRVAAYHRYLNVLFIPAFLFALYILLTKTKKIRKWEEYSVQWPIINYLFPLLFSIVIMTGFYKYDSHNDNNAYVVYKKLRNKYDIRNKNIICIEQGGCDNQLLQFRYYVFGDTTKVRTGSYGPIADNIWRTPIDKNNFINQLKEFDAIVVLETDAWLNNIMAEHINCKTEGLKQFVIVKDNNKFELLKL